MPVQQETSILELRVLSVLRRRDNYQKYKDLVNVQFFRAIELQVIYRAIADFFDRSQKKFLTVKELWYVLEKQLDEDDLVLYRTLLLKIKKESKEDDDSIHQAVIRFAQESQLRELAQVSTSMLSARRGIDTADLKGRMDRILSLNGSHKERLYDYMDLETSRLKEDPRKDRLPTGLSDELDEHISGGLGKGELAFFLGPPKRGKTVALVNLGANALRQGKRVLHATLEIQAKAVARRYDSCLTEMEFNDLIEHPQVLKRALTEVREAGGELVIQDYTYIFCNTAHISSFIEKQKKPFDLIIVDFADLMVHPQKLENTRFELTRIYQELRIMAGQFNVPVWTASQGNRGSMQQRSVGMENIAEAFSKAGIVDLMIGLSQTADEREEKEMRLQILGSRIGPTGLTVRVLCDPLRMQLKDGRKGARANIGNRPRLVAKRSGISRVQRKPPPGQKAVPPKDV